MIDPADNKTVDLFPAKRGRGRPVTGKAKTDAERMRAYRLRKKQRQAVARIDDIQAGMALAESVYDRVDELEKSVADYKAIVAQQAELISDFANTIEQLIHEKQALEAQIKAFAPDELEFLVNELRSKNAALETQVRMLTNDKLGLIAVQKQKDVTHKGQITKLRNGFTH